MKTTIKPMKWYRFTFASGVTIDTRGMNAAERRWNEQQYGKLISKVYIGTF